MSCEITVDDFKEQFDRGQFSYGDTLPEIRDKDITGAIAEAQAIFNDSLYPTDETCQQALLYLTAHFLYSDVDAEESGGQPSFIVSSHSADGLSDSVSVPEWMMQGEFSFYATTYYGQKFLMLSKPYLDGAVVSVSGGTRY